MLRIPGVSHAIVRSAATSGLVTHLPSFLRGHVEIAGRLVGENNRRIITQRPRDGDALPESPLVPVESEPPESELLPGAPPMSAPRPNCSSWLAVWVS